MGSEKKVDGELDAAAASGMVRVNNGNRVDGKGVVDFTFLFPWLGPVAGPFLRAIATRARGYASAQQAYGQRRVLQCWAQASESEGLLRPNRQLSNADIMTTLSRLRQLFYETETSRGPSLFTTTHKWLSFLSLLDDLYEIGAMPRVDTSHPAISTPRRKDVRTGRDGNPGMQASSTAPRTFKPENNSFNDNLLEPISIVASDGDYLDEYEARLSQAIGTIKACALAEFVELERKREQGKALIQTTDYEAVKHSFRLGRWDRSEPRYIDPSNGLHYFEPEGGHPNLLGNLLAMVHHEMGPIPMFRIGTGKPGTKRGQKTVFGRPHWSYIAKYDKNRLLPYLGIMTASAAAICIAIILLEHPKINATALHRAVLCDTQGRQILLGSAGEVRRLRLSVDKPRADESKSVILSSLAERVIVRVLEWTDPIRKALRKEGRAKEAQRLWIGMSQLMCHLSAFSESTLVNNLKPASFRSYGKNALRTRTTSFVARNPELSNWATRLTFKAIRVNVGILVYLRTNGDLVATALAFGHRDIKTTIENYIPKLLRLAIYERQIRRHQLFLIASAVQDEAVAMAACNFSRIEELHQFLLSFDKIDVAAHTNGVDSNLVEPEKRHSKSKTHRIVLMKDPGALAVAMLYRDKLAFASPAFLMKKDSKTGLAPHFWIEFVDSLLRPLPFSMRPVGKLVVDALTIKDELKGRIRLPDIA